MKVPKTIIFCDEPFKKEKLSHLTCTYTLHKSDVDVLSILSKEAPDIIVSVGEKCKIPEKYPHLCDLPLTVRKRWLHFETFESISENALQYCMSYQLNNHFLTQEEMLKEPLISVFTTSFKSKHRIQRPWNTLIKQKWKHWEWIIIDDTDENDDDGENWKQLRSIANSDYRIRSFKPHEHSGIIGALKRDASMLCKGDILVELDHDDDLHPDTFLYLIAAFREHPNAGMFWTDFAEVFEDDVNKNYSYGEFYAFGHGAYCKQRCDGIWRNMARTPALNSLTLRHIIGVPNHVRAWSKKAYHEIGGHSPYLHVADDYELCVRTFLKYDMISIPRLCYLQYRNEGGNNFTFIRNAEIQKLHKEVSKCYEQKIIARLEELGIPDRKGIPNNRAWLKVNEPEFEKRADKLGGLPVDQLSVVICVEKESTKEQILLSVQSAISQTHEHLQIVVIGFSNSNLDLAMEEVFDERVHWWNLSDPVNQNRMIARNYAVKMMAFGKYIAYCGAGQVFSSFQHIENQYVDIEKEDFDNNHQDLLFVSNSLLYTRNESNDEDISGLFHSRKMLDYHGFWRVDLSSYETIQTWYQALTN